MSDPWAPVSLPGVVCDRAAWRRGEPGLIESLRGTSSSRVILVHRSRIATVDGAIEVLTPAEADNQCHSTQPPIWLYLGAEGGHEWLGLLLPEESVMEHDSAGGAHSARQWIRLRDLLDAPVPQAPVATTAVALASWHAGHRFCPRCGAGTVVESAGWTRRCVVHGTELYPRTDPAVIMAVTDEEDRLLLGHAAQWPQRRFSTLAGFIEPGESAEEAVRREVAEEVSVTVGNVTYWGSQPWPFPSSLMLAYVARAISTAVRPDGIEITEAAWFTRSELCHSVATGAVELPGTASIARKLIEDWYGAPLTCPVVP